MTLVAGVDSSTQSCKLEVRDADSGDLVRSGHRPHPPTVPPQSEQDPNAWWDALSSLLDEHGRDLAAISVAGQQHGMVVLEEARRVLRPAKLWNDTESAPQADALVCAWGASAWADAFGSVPVASFTITKLAWLREVEPEVFRRVAHVLLPHDWLTLQLTGEIVTDRGDASGTGYWSPTSGDYADEALAIVELDRSVTPSVYPQVLADLLQRPVAVAATAEYVARGACVQAAAVLSGRDVAAVAHEWAPDNSRTVEPDPKVDAAGVRAQYRDLRQRTHPESGDRT